MEPPAHRVPFPIPAPVVARRHGRLRLRPLSNSLPTHLARSSTQHVPTNKENGNITLDNSGLSLQERAQQVLHGVSSRAGSARVAKSPKQARLPHDARSAFSAANAPQQSRARSTALDAALNALRTTYLGDQDRLEDQMAVKEKARESERSEYRATIKMQLETILEQRLKLAKSEEWLAKLEQKFNSTQKYVAGLQRDHEDMKKSMVTFQKQDKKTLQDQIAQVVKEKEDLQAGLEAMVESCEKSQRSMLKTMHEIQLRYVTALSREHDLKIRLNERMTMYEEEKHRKAELEQQVLPFIQAIQRQLSGSSATLIEKIGGLQASMGGQTTENSRDSTVKKCLLILQQLQSQPPLTSKDVRKAEDMLRYLYEKTDAGLEIVTRGLNENPISIEDIRDCVRDQIQGLQAEILGNNQAIAEDNLAREVNQRLATDMDTEKQKNRQLEEQAASLQHSEATLKSRITSLEQEMGELRNSIEAQQAEPCESEKKIAELEVQLSTMTEDLRKSSAVVEGHERLYLEEELKFCKYRADALAHLANLKKYIWQITDDDKAKARECSALMQDVTKLRAQLDFEKTKTGQLTAEVSQYNGDMIIINQEKNDAIEEEGRTRETLQFAEDTNRELQLENEKLSTVIQEVRKDLVASKSAEQKLTSKCTGLRNQVNALQDAKVAGDRQLRQEQHDSQTQLQQAETNKIASLADLRSSLKLSEDARKELQAKLRQKEAAHKEQIEHHQQTTNTKFEDLAAQSHQKQEKLKAKLRQEMEKCEQDAEARVADTRRETKRLVNEAETRKAEMAAEAERRLKEAGISATRILVPNTQQSEQNGTPSSQQSHSERTRKKVDRQTNSVTVVASSSRRPLGSAQGHSFLNSAAISDRRQEGSENEMGYFEQEYESRFGSQVLSQHQETQPSILDSGVETVPETQHFEYDQGVAAQLKILESQVIASDNADQENLTDLSTIPSEDLSEMLMDIHPRSQQHRHTPKHASSSSREFGTPGNRYSERFKEELGRR
ncbi:hypothetical protein N0V91_003645 [Didymella pomorum]|uniref:Uncharacterized protein n=1 Tax=Didymella pomorum TaxID=749634 RepID=A0A9W8ZIF0_9PLEO|nr:hypothetical protein N0V91_003645 [Didymella pomorum]